MFNCCCVNKKALKKAAADSEGLNENSSKKEKPCDNNNSNKPPLNAAADESSCKSPIRNDKSNSSDEDNNLSRLSGLILSDGLVEEIDIQLKNRLDRKRSVDTTSGGSNVTVIEGNLPADDGENSEELCDSLKQCCDEKAVQPPLASCLFRQGSVRASIKKKVRCSESAEVIPPPEYIISDSDNQVYSHEDDDDVFSDNAPVQTPRGNMCTPYVERKGSLPGLEALPDWFPNSSENCSTPPTTPLDELALKRHRFFADLIDAANNAIEQRVRFDSLGPIVAEVDKTETPMNTPSICDPSVSQPKELINLIGRLETIVNRLEQQSAPVQTTEEGTFTGQPQVSSSYSQTDLTTPDDRFLPTVLPHIEQRLEKLQQEQRRSKLIEQETSVVKNAMSVNAYEDIILGPLAQFLSLSKTIGDDVAVQAEFVQKAFDAQLKYLTMASQSSAPDASELPKLLQPTSEQINNVQTFRETHRTSKLFNHLSAISESVPALGWVCVSPTPGPHVKEMNDAGQFYTNRVLKEWKEKDVKHVNWAKTWVQTLTELQAYIKQYHTTGIVWSGKTKAVSNNGAPPPPPMGNLPPPPPMPVFDLSASAGDDDRNALFAQINKGADITKSLKKVSSEMQTHKNPVLRSGVAPIRTGPTPFKPAIAVKPTAAAPVDKPPVFSRDGKKWLIEYQKNNRDLLVDNAEMNNVVYMFKSVGSTLTVKGKINSIVIDSCKKCSVVFDSLVSSVEFVNCQSVQMQVLGKVPTISIDKTDGCQMFLNKESYDVEIVSSKSSEMNVMLPTPAGDDYIETPIPEQFKTVISNNALQTTCVESLG